MLARLRSLHNGVAAPTWSIRGEVEEANDLRESHEMRAHAQVLRSIVMD